MDGRGPVNGDATTPVFAQVDKARRLHGDPIARNWSANFEYPVYAERPDLVVVDAVRAIAATGVATAEQEPFVNLVTPGELGDPAGYLIPALRQALGETVHFEEAGQCDCGGYVVRCRRQA